MYSQYNYTTTTIKLQLYYTTGESCSRALTKIIGNLKSEIESYQAILNQAKSVVKTAKAEFGQ